jgi:SAM-dependent methyltransferase
MSEKSPVDGWEHVDCPLCGRNRTETRVVLPDAEQGHVVRCRPCGIVFRSPRRREYVQTRHISDEWFPESAPHDFIKIYRSNILARIRALVFRYHPTPGAILDVGSSYGHLLSLFPPEWHRSGVEPSQRACRHAQEMVPDATFHNAILSAAPLPKRAYDVVTLIDCIYYFPYPLRALARLSRSLRPGGLIFIEAPNVRNRLLVHRLLGRYFQANWMYFYDKDALEKLLNKASIRVVARIDFPSSSINDPRRLRRMLAWSEFLICKFLRIVSFGRLDYVSHFVLVGQMQEGVRTKSRDIRKTLTA